MQSALAEQPKETVPQRTTKVVAQILHLCHTLEGIRDDFIPLLPELSDKKIIEVRGAARIVGVWAWIVECACDSELFERVEAKKGGRGNVDEDEEGRLAAIRQQAYRDAKGVSTLYRNAQIFNTFGAETILTHGNTLQDKGFWITALSAPDPHEAIETFVEKKTVNPFWEVQDAQKAIDPLKERHETAKKDFVEQFRNVNRKAVGEWIVNIGRPGVAALKTQAPEPRLVRFFDEMDKQLSEHEDVLFMEDAQSALLFAWEKGYRTEPQMGEFTRLLPIEIRRVMLELEEKGYFVEQPMVWKQKTARGTRTKEWKRTDKPLPQVRAVPADPNIAPSAGS